MTDPRPLPVVVGTAGHIDHGKSALIEALTGTHPDRWREEQERGITLDLGYAQLGFPDGLELGFVDVPGHEKLVRKMVAGATGMGAAMLVVACDDGVMPQTREHFQVLQLLGVQQGLVVLSKADLADAEVRELVRADVETLLEGTSWEGAPVVEASALTGEGVDALRTALRGIAERAGAAQDDLHAFRLPVQRSFALHGAGTVVTGVCASGSVSDGDVVEVLPAGQKSRVRKVQVHGRPAESGRTGLRVALNLPEVQPGSCRRGSVIAAPGSLPCGRLLRLLVQPLPGVPRLQHGAAVSVLAHTAAVPGRLFLPPEARERAAVAPPEGWLCDLELEEPLAFVPGERLILRRPSPGLNLAAGRFLLPGALRLRRRDAAMREALQGFAAAREDPVLYAARLLDLPGAGPSRAAAVAAQLGWTPDAAQHVLQRACELGEARATAGERFLGVGSAGALGQEVASLIGHWRSEQPHRLRIPVARLRQGLGKSKARALEDLPEGDLAALGLARRPGLEWDLLEAEAPRELAGLAEQLLPRLQEAGLQPPGRGALASDLGASEDEVQRAGEYLVDSGRAVCVDGELVFALQPVEALRAALVEQLRSDGVDIPGLRDRFATSRKFLMPLLEFLDDRGVTMRRGPKRILKDAAAPLV